MERGILEPGIGSGICRQWHIIAVPAVVRPGIALALLALQCCRLAYRYSGWNSADRGHWLHCRQNTGWCLKSQHKPIIPKPSVIKQLRRPQPIHCLHPAHSEFIPARVSNLTVSSSSTFRSKLKRRLQRQIPEAEQRPHSDRWLNPIVSHSRSSGKFFQTHLCDLPGLL